MFKLTPRFAAVTVLALATTGFSAAFAQSCAVTGSDPVPICRTSSKVDADIKATSDSHKSFKNKNIVLGSSPVQKRAMTLSK